MAPRQYHYYQGEYRTIHQLAKSAMVSEPILRKRLKEGWDLEDAMMLPTGRCGIDVDPALIGKTLKIVFQETIPSVFECMQPKLNTPYLAKLQKGRRSIYKARPYCIIHLERGKPLIVYPEEFQILQVCTEQAG
jgi:hypothetical protein